MQNKAVLLNFIALNVFKTNQEIVRVSGGEVCHDYFGETLNKTKPGYNYVRDSKARGPRAALPIMI